MAFAADDFPWTKSVDKNGVIHSKRMYLLVDALGKPDEMQIQVTSICEGDLNSEAQDRQQCEHHLRFKPTNKTLTLHGGYDVGLTLRSPIGPMITTDEPGCCAAPDTIMYYALDGVPIGMLETQTPAYPGNIGKDVVFMQEINSIHQSVPQYMIVKPSDNGRLIKEPVEINFTDKMDCKYWLFAGLIKTERDMQLRLQGDECDGGRWTGSCNKHGDSWRCDLAPVPAG